jgi:hypothetical protein
VKDQHYYDSCFGGLLRYWTDLTVGQVKDWTLVLEQCQDGAIAVILLWHNSLQKLPPPSKHTDWQIKYSAFTQRHSSSSVWMPSFQPEFIFH